MESREGKGKAHSLKSFVTHWPLTTTVINDFRTEHMTLNNAKWKIVQNYGRVFTTPFSTLELILCAAQIEKTGVLEQILSSITELSYS